MRDSPWHRDTLVHSDPVSSTQNFLFLSTQNFRYYGANPYCFKRADLRRHAQRKNHKTATTTTVTTHGNAASAGPRIKIGRISSILTIHFPKWHPDRR